MRPFTVFETDIVDMGLGLLVLTAAGSASFLQATPVFAARTRGSRSRRAAWRAVCLGLATRH